MYPSIGKLTSKNYEQLLRDGIQAARAGQRKLARSLLNQATLINAADARAWLWLSTTCEDPFEQRRYLEKAVVADPGNAAARRALVLLSDELELERLLPEGASPEPLAGGEQESHVEAWRCPQCGGKVRFDPALAALVCQHCGYQQSILPVAATGAVEKPVDFILPTTRAHRWAQSRQRTGCRQCGAVIMLSPGQIADQCPYCGSHRTIDSPQALELVDPQVIALMKIDRSEALRRARLWLGEGWWTLDDLAQRAGKLQLRPGYYPFWAFDGILEIPWRCEVNEGSGRYSHWVTHSGVVHEIFDDLLVSGLRALLAKDLTQIEPFPKGELVEFSPDFLAGWPALTYDIPLAEASLKAREQVVAGLRRNLYARVEPGKEKRELSSGAGKWSGMTYKLALLPLWVGNYTYRGRYYRLLVNGQTGMVGGDKPRDDLKLVMVAAGFGVLALLVALLVWWFFNH